MTRKASWKMRVGVAVLALGMLGIAVPRTAAAATQPAVSESVQNSNLTNEVGHKLAMVPWYGVFDNLGYSVNGTEVTLTGAVVNPATKSDAVGYVKNIKGVTNVVDQIHVLPLSNIDNRIRRQEYRSIFSYGGLFRYAMGSNPSIHIIVDNGHVTLVGYVNNEGDLKAANIRANAVPGVFSVTNNLQIAATRPM